MLGLYLTCNMYIRLSCLDSEQEPSRRRNARCTVDLSRSNSYNQKFKWLYRPILSHLGPIAYARLKSQSQRQRNTILSNVYEVHTTLLTCNYHQFDTYTVSTCSPCCVIFFFAWIYYFWSHFYSQQK